MVTQQVKNLTSTHDDVGLIPGRAHWVKDLAMPPLWCRSNMWLGSCSAVAVVLRGNFQMLEVHTYKY